MHFLLSFSLNGAKMKKLISLTLMLSILSGCVVSYNYETLEDNISYIGQTTIQYGNIKENSILLIGNNYLFVLNFIDEKNKNEIEQLFQRVVKEHKTFIMRNSISYSNVVRIEERNRTYHNFICITDTIPNNEQFYKKFEDEKNCAFVYGNKTYYYKINANIVNDVSKAYKLKIPAKIKISTDKKSGVNVGDTMLGIPLTIFGFAAMVGAK